MILTLFLSHVSVFAASTVITVSADKTKAEPGDTIDFTITLGPVSNMGTMQMVIVIPKGLTYLEGSGKLAEGLQQTLGYDMASFTEVSMMVNGVASRADYSSDEDTLLCTFRCKVDEGFQGLAEVSLTRLEFCSCQTWQDHTSEYSVRTAMVQVSKIVETSPEESESSSKPEKQPVETTEEPQETRKPEEIEPVGTTEAVRPTKTQPDESTDSSKASSEARPDGPTKEQTKPLPSGSEKSSEATSKSATIAPGPAQSTERGRTEPGDNSSERSESREQSSEEATKSGESGTEADTVPESTDTAEDNGQGNSNAAKSSEENTDRSETASSGTSDQNKDDQNGRDTRRKGALVWIIIAAAAVITGAAVLFILSAREKRGAAASERGKSRKRKK